ncbi:ORF6N domain-containing protein [Bacteroides sp. 51]
MLDSDVAELYSVETKHINEAVKNNPDKFLMNTLFHHSKETGKT